MKFLLLTTAMICCASRYLLLPLVRFGEGLIIVLSSEARGSSNLDPLQGNDSGSLDPEVQVQTILPDQPQDTVGKAAMIFKELVKEMPSKFMIITPSDHLVSQ